MWQVYTAELDLNKLEVEAGQYLSQQVESQPIGKPMTSKEAAYWAYRISRWGHIVWFEPAEQETV